MLTERIPAAGWLEPSALFSCCRDAQNAPLMALEKVRPFSVRNTSVFQSSDNCSYYIILAITTVGYGEIISRSFMGRIFTLPLLLFGLLLISLPYFVLGREFYELWGVVARRRCAYIFQKLHETAL
jgi:hypothetical protein